MPKYVVVILKGDSKVQVSGAQYPHTNPRDTRITDKGGLWGGCIAVQTERKETAY
ncbi:MAG TPA: hypothetical protein VJH24_01275 [Candidatus Bilamarchaeaceae archaeon]|nr:hypothetical protein [Candidatus Bilamarchaeaceae archaeon]